MIVFFDPKNGRGGGQVVLEGLLSLSSPSDDVALVMSSLGQASLTVPTHVRTATSAEELFAGEARPKEALLVANANSSFISVGRAARALRRQGSEVRTLGIVHNYPSSWPKARATAFGVSLMDDLVVVEPGLAALARDAFIPPWLGLSPLDPDPVRPRQWTRTGKVKSYGRPDRTKGLHVLANIFPELESLGLECRVALGTPLDGQTGYERHLRSLLAPWLEDGQRSSAWVEPGDTFIIPSLAGEAACLTAQEVMARGAWVVASRIGLMPYLSPTGDGISTFRRGSAAGAIGEVLLMQQMSEDDYSASMTAATEQLAARKGAWYEATWTVLRRMSAPAGHSMVR